MYLPCKFPDALFLVLECIFFHHTTNLSPNPKQKLKMPPNSCSKCNMQYNIGYAPKQAISLRNFCIHSLIYMEAKSLSVSTRNSENYPCSLTGLTFECDKILIKSVLWHTSILLPSFFLFPKLSTVHNTLLV